MNKAAAQLDAGGLVPTKTKVDPGATEQIVARTYRHAALGDRAVIRLASDRLGQAEDLAMEFLGFPAPEVSAPLALQQRRSLGFAAWALVNDPANARFALDLVKQMKAAARQGKSKPGHAWDAYMEMAKELGRSVRHFLPAFWEEVGRAFKDLGNQTYAGRALNKSLEAERVHALESDRARRRDVVLEFVLSGCLTGSALSDYGTDLQGQYPPTEAFAIFRDLCVRRTQGGMPPWASLPKDFMKLAKAAGLDAEKELERWLEEVIESPAMGRPPLQFWKTCGAACKRIVVRNSAFAVALLRHTKPDTRYYGESKLGPWLDLLDEWGVLEYLWHDEHRGAPALGEPVAHWFSRIVCDAIPAPARTLEMLEKLAPRLKHENVPLALSAARRHHNTAIDIDVLEACLVLGIKLADPTGELDVSFWGWLSPNADHRLRNQDVVESAKDERFKTAIMHGLEQALACRGGTVNRGYWLPTLEQQAFPLAARKRPGIKELWRAHMAGIITNLERSGLASFELVYRQLKSTLWPDALRLFPDLAERLKRLDPVAMLRRTLQAGVFDEYGWPALEEAPRGLSIHFTFPHIVVRDSVHAVVIGGDGAVKKYELRLPPNCQIMTIVAVGDDLAVGYRDQKFETHFYWVSNPAQHYEASAMGFYGSGGQQAATILEDGSVFLGQQAVRPGEKQMPQWQLYVHDGQRFWRESPELDQESREYQWKLKEVDPHTGKVSRESVPAWFEETEGGRLLLEASDLRPAPPGSGDSPLGTKAGMIGWKTVERRDGRYFGVGIDGRRWDKPLLQHDGTVALPVALLRQVGTNEFLPVTTAGPQAGQRSLFQAGPNLYVPVTGGPRAGSYSIWDPSGSTTIASLQDSGSDHASGQATALPLSFWHFLRPRDQASSQKLRKISERECAALLKAAEEDRKLEHDIPRGRTKETALGPLERLLPAVKKLLPTAPERMALGIARIIERAGRTSAAFVALRDEALADSTKESKTSTPVVNLACDRAAAFWGMEPFPMYGADEEISTSAHLAAAAEFLKGKSNGGDLPQTCYLWFTMLENLPLRCWQTYWRSVAEKMTGKEKGELPWIEFLKLWHDLGIAALPGELAVMDGHPEGAKKNAFGGYDVELIEGRASAIRNGDDLFVVLEGRFHQLNRLPYHILRYSTAKTPGVPPGFQAQNVRKIKPRYDRAEIDAFIAAVKSCSTPPLPPRAELEEIAGKISASPAEIGLVWLGGLNLSSYQSNFLPAELRTALGLKAAEVNAGRQALSNLDPSVLNQLFESVVSQGCAAPFAADRKPTLDLIEKAWRAHMPQRFHMDAALQTRLAALGKTSPWQRTHHQELLALVADPANHPLLEPRETEITINKNAAYGSLQLTTRNNGEESSVGGALRSIVHLVALVHAETPAGHSCRAAMPALVKRTTMLLSDSTTMVGLFSTFTLENPKYKTLKPSDWLSKHLGKTVANAKDGTTRFDDGLITAAAIDSGHQVMVAFRPAKLKDRGDMARLQGILAIEAAAYSPYRGLAALVATIKSPGFQKLAKAIQPKNVPEGEWPQNPSHTAAAVVKAIRAKYKLSEDGAVLYAQLLALPDPTAANIRKWNGWTAAQLKTAADELVKGKLVLEAVRERAGRSIFLPGEWAELKAPWLPIEAWKLAHLVELDMQPGEVCPAGGPLVLRPFEDLFAAAWQRVLDGDGPRYEEVKRRKKTK